MPITPDDRARQTIDRLLTDAGSLTQFVKKLISQRPALSPSSFSVFRD